MTKGDRLAAIAAKWFRFSDNEMQEHINDRMNAGDSMVLQEIREMAGSCLSQPEPQIDWPVDDPRWRKRDEDIRREAIPWTDLKSSNLKSCRFDPVTAELEIEFLNGASWAYRGVSASVAAGLAVAESPRKFFNANIKSKYEGAGTKPLPPASTGREAFVRSLKER